MKFKPLYDRVLVAVDKPAEKTESGIYLPQAGREEKDSQARIGTIIAIGDGYRDKESGKIIPVSLKVGQRVVFTKYTGTDLKVNGEDMIVIPEWDVEGILEE